MICKHCRDGDHEGCDGLVWHPTYCDCAHHGADEALTRVIVRPLTAAEEAEDVW